jgi:flavin-dependent dehydrogenase
LKPRAVINTITILGGGPAGAAASIALRSSGADVAVVEKSKFPRHKVCGEFLSPESRLVFESFGVDTSAAPPIRRVALQFARAEKRFALPDAAFGWSRYAMDAALIDRARSLGAEVASESKIAPDIVATGRRSSPPRGRRLFGFKAHFSGPSNDAVELYFFRGGYVGVNPVEGGVTNVCGLLPEDELLPSRFDLDSIAATFAPLRERLAPLTRMFPWMHVGPLQFGPQKRTGSGLHVGDAREFVDPFTGSGMTAALLSGQAAAASILRDEDASGYERRVRAMLGKPFAFSAVFRETLFRGWAERMVGFVPGALLYRLTRPRCSSLSY